VGEHLDHARHRKCGGAVDLFDASFGDLAVDDETVRKIWHIELGRIFRRAGHFDGALNPRYRLADAVPGERAHDAAYPITLTD
jgi:hypothetical protein